MNCVSILFMLPLAHCNAMNSTMYHTHSVTYIVNRLSAQDKIMLATKILLVPSPLYVYIVYDFDAMGHVATPIAHQSCRLIMTYKKGF